VVGHGICSDSPWAISFIPQAQFWRSDFAATYGDGRIHDKLSAAIADWTTPGVLYGKPASGCTPEEVVRETWEQIKRHVNGPGAPRLTDAMLAATDVDPGMTLRSGCLVSEDPLVLPTAGTAQHRPDVRTRVRNLVLCGDYLTGSWIITTMESANHTARRAANAILERSGSNETPTPELEPYRPPEWETLQRADEVLHRAGQPNLLDAPVPNLERVLSAL
jgi:uncharacterized protein with NAD-binding domain and iron-sulfur cluster